MVKRVIASIVATYFISLSVFSQNKDSVYVVQSPVDSLEVTVVSDTVAWIDDKVKVDKSTEQILNNSKPFKPDSKKAVIYSAVFPGMGQFYNRKYWKLPIVYGGFIGLVYAISWNGKYYGDYTDAYKAIMSENRFKEGYVEKWKHFIKMDPGTNIEEAATEARLKSWQNSFKSKRNYFRRNRDLSIIGTVALYALCMIDAYVDAQLFDFDISPDLTFRIEPKVETNAFSQKSFGLQCSIKF